MSQSVIHSFSFLAQDVVGEIVVLVDDEVKLRTLALGIRIQCI